MYLAISVFPVKGDPKPGSAKYEKWLEEHALVYQKNHDGSAGSMEAAAAERRGDIFLVWGESRGLHIPVRSF